MYKSKALIFAIISILIGLYVVYTTLSVLDSDSAARYSQVSAPTATVETKQTHEPAMATPPAEPAVVEEEASSQEMTEQDGVVEAEPEESVVETKVDETASAPATAPSGEAQVHVVTAQGLIYEPLVSIIQPGDTVAWENMSSHDTQSMEDLIPSGAEHWHSAMGENYQRTFTVEGIYVYKCTPHFGAGMGGAIIVGQPTNLADIQAVEVKGAAKRLVKKALAAAAGL
jgi:pseudoazurin